MNCHWREIRIGKWRRVHRVDLELGPSRSHQRDWPRPPGSSSGAGRRSGGSVRQGTGPIVWGRFSPRGGRGLVGLSSTIARRFLSMPRRQVLWECSRSTCCGARTVRGPSGVAHPRGGPSLAKEHRPRLVVIFLLHPVESDTATQCSGDEGQAPASTATVPGPHLRRVGRGHSEAADARRWLLLHSNCCGECRRQGRAQWLPGYFRDSATSVAMGCAILVVFRRGSPHGG